MRQDILKLAKQGNPRAIATLLKHRLQSEGISVQASLRDDCLRIVLKSEQIPDEQIMTDLVQRDIAILSPSAIARVKIFGQQIGDDIPVWSRNFELIGQPKTDNISVHHAQPVENAVHCPKCSYTQIMATKKGFDVGGAAVGAVLFGPLGLAGGMIGGNQLMLSCMKCGHQWIPGETIEIEHRVTEARVKVMNTGDRVSSAGCSFVLLGIVGILLFFAIPPVGALVLCMAILMPLLYLCGSKDHISSLIGNCPHCDKEVEVHNMKAESSNCSHCKKKFLIREQKFYTI